MAKGLLKKLGLAAAITGSALFGAKESKASPVDWNSFSQVASENNFGGQTVNYVSSSVNFRDQYGNAIANNPQFSLVYYASVYDGINMAVGGLDGSGNSASGWFLGAEGNYGVGLANGGTANYTEGNIDNGYWRMFVDLNGDGNYGTYDSETGLFDFDDGEMITGERVSNFQGFQTGVGTLSAGDISGWYAVPEPSTGVLTALGLSALALRRKRRPVSTK